MGFKDHFSHHADVYAAARPSYPDALFAFIAAQCAVYEQAWDCGCGNGQAARSLTAYFQHVTATDASAQQISQALPHPRIDYLACAAEKVPLATASVDLVTVAQALHWFDLDGFYPEVQRILKPGAVVAAWCYGIHRVCPAVDELVGELYGPVTGPWWPAERRHVETLYQHLAFPFERIECPQFTMTQEWSLAQLQAYLYSWSGVQRYIKERKQDPVAAMAARLQMAWGSAEKRTISWPMSLLLGRTAQS